MFKLANNYIAQGAQHTNDIILLILCLANTIDIIKTKKKSNYKF